VGAVVANIQGAERETLRDSHGTGANGPQRWIDVEEPDVLYALRAVILDIAAGMTAEGEIKIGSGHKHPPTCDFYGSNLPPTFLDLTRRSNMRDTVDPMYIEIIKLGYMSFTQQSFGTLCVNFRWVSLSQERGS
jgi:hypothetical protein